MITVTWTPSTTSAEVDVAISVSTVELVFMKFTPQVDTQPFSFNDGTNSSTGTFQARFFADGQSGILIAQNWQWDVGGLKGQYEGVIANW
jgi:hypothetical protein